MQPAGKIPSAGTVKARLGPPGGRRWATAAVRVAVCCLLAGASPPRVAAADVPGVMPGIPEPGQRNAIVQLFNWRFNDVRAVLPHLRELGYSHVHVSPREKSNERVRQWWGRYRPVDYATIEPATAPPTPKRRGRPPKARPAG